MRVPKLTGILSVVIICFTLLNFILKSYTYFTFIIRSKNLSEQLGSGSGGIAQDTEDEHHPKTIFIPLLTFIPCKSPVLSRPWVFLTSGYVHESVLSIPAVALIFYLGKYIENLWGTRELFKYVVTIQLTSNVFIYCYYKVYVNVFHHDFVPPVVQGTMAILMAFFVVVKQRISNHYIIFFLGGVRIKVTFIPLILTSVLFVVLLIDDDYLITYFHALVSWIFSWVYLRFFKNGSNESQNYLLPFALNKRRSMRKQRQHIESSLPAGQIEDASVAAAIAAAAAASSIDRTLIKGDRSAQFAFHTFFPYPLALIVKEITQALFASLSKYDLVNANSFPEYEEEEENDINDVTGKSFLLSQINNTNNLQLGLFGLSPLKGVHQRVSPLSDTTTTSTIKNVWNWISKSSKAETEASAGINYNMDKRRKMALSEFE